MNCKNCGKELPGAGDFCPYCGTRQTLRSGNQAERDGLQTGDGPVKRNKGRKRLFGRKKSPHTGTGKSGWKKWLKRIGIGLGAIIAVLFLYIIVNQAMSSRKAECPDPALFFELDWQDNDYFGSYDDSFDETAASDLPTEVVWEAMEEYVRLLEQSGAKVTLDDKSGTNGNDCYCLEADFGRDSLANSSHRRVQLDYYLPEGRFFLNITPFYGRWISFVHTEPYSAPEEITEKPEEEDVSLDTTPASADDAESTLEDVGETVGTAAPVITDTAVPDFQAFCSNNLYLSGVTEHSDYTEYVYFWKYNGKAMDEYLDLLQDAYHFELRGEKVVSSINSYRYSFDYTGSGSAGTYNEDGMDGSDGEGIALYVWDLHVSPIEGEVHICLADGFDYMDTGDRTTRKITPYQESNTSAGSSGGEEACWYCDGSGDCPTCGGRGTVRNWLPGTTEYVEQDCTDCASPGKCRVCGGSGRS